MLGVAYRVRVKVTVRFRVRGRVLLGLGPAIGVLHGEEGHASGL